MNQILRFLIFLLLIFVLAFFQVRKKENLSKKEYLKLKTNLNAYISSIGFNRNQGNIVGIQTFMIPADYSNEERFFKKLEEYVLEAQRNGFLNKNTLIVFPEHIGTPLILVDEEKKIYFEDSFLTVLELLIENQSFFKTEKNISSDTKNLFLKKSSKMKDIYTRVFAQLSRFYNVTILAGSIVLPNPKYEQGYVSIYGNDLKNTAFIFSNGKLLPSITYKNNLSELEENLKLETNSTPTIYQIPNLNTSFLILLSHDSLYNQNYSVNAEIILAPSASYEKEKIFWQNPSISDTFKGDKSLFLESDKDLSLEELWSKFGPAGKFSYLSNKIYMQVFFRGEFFKKKFIGNSSMGYRHLKTDTVPSEFKEAILNVYL